MDKFEVKKELLKYGISPRKNLGQYFLVDKDILRQIIAEANLKKDDNVVEVGPGLGVLTKELLSKGARVIAIEYDFNMVSYLKDKFKEEKKLKIIKGNALDEIPKLNLKNYKIAANLPYQITSPFFNKVLAKKNLPNLIIVLVQKEMAERIAAKPHDSNRGFLSVMVQLFGEPKIIANVPKESFYPMPKVESAILSLKTKRLKIPNIAMLIKIVQAGFSQKRKKIRNSIAASFRIEPREAEKIIKKANIDPNKRAEDLEIADWKKLEKKFRVCN